MTALKRFKKMPLHAQQGVVSRAKSGLIDEPEGFAEMCAIVEEQELLLRDRPLQGGTRVGEVLDHQARVRAGLVDRPGERFERRPAERYEHDVFSPFRERRRGFVPARPWERH